MTEEIFQGGGGGGILSPKILVSILARKQESSLACLNIQNKQDYSATHIDRMKMELVLYGETARSCTYVGKWLAA